MKKNRGLMLLTGEPGVGKTLALRSFVENLNPGLYFCSYIPLSTVSPIDFYRQLNLKLTGEFRHRKVDLFNSIQAAVRDMVTNQKKVPVIIIDEAHLLMPDNLQEIQIILNFDIDSTNPAIFIMAGQSHLRDKVAAHVNISLSQRFSLKFHLTPLDKPETASYIAHRLAVCGCKRSPFSDSAIEAIFQNTQGIPRNIDNLALKSLTLAALENKTSITEEEIFAASKEL
jgi:type II secretory pathway predicted ATPase ExeA